MSDKERSLPKPPGKAFGRNKISEDREEEQGPLLADRMAVAAAEGKLDEFLKREMPDNEYARNLAGMMMGMTGMMPGMPSPSPVKPEAQAQKPNAEEKNESSVEVPEDVREAILGGDMGNVMALLRREHQKRHPDAQIEPAQEHAPSAEPAAAAGQPAIDKEIIDALVAIASENGVTLDWIMLRAVKMYVREYQKTGKL